MTRKKLTTVVAVLLIAVSAVSVGFAGSAAAVSPTSTQDLSTSYSNVSVTVQDVPENGFNGGLVKVNTSEQSGIDETNITISPEDGASFNDQDSSSEVVMYTPSYGDVADENGEYNFDIEVDGAVESTVSVDSVATDAAESSIINASDVENASTVNVTVDESEVDAENQFLTQDTENGTAVQFRFADNSSNAAEDIAVAEFDNFTDGTQTLDVKSLGSNAIVDSADSLSITGEGRIYAGDAVESIEIDGETVYQESGGGGGFGGDGGSPIVVIVVAVIAGAYVVSKL